MSEQDEEELDESVNIKMEDTQNTFDNEITKEMETEPSDTKLNSLVYSIHMEIKQEICDTEIITPNTKSSQENTEIVIKQEEIAESNVISVSDTTECMDNVKHEVDQDNSIVSYDFPQFDSTSIDSSEGSAMGPPVEAVIQEPFSIKLESNEYQCKEIANVDIKLESDMTVTETNLVPNKIATDYHQPDNSLVMEMPLLHLRLVGQTTDNVEEILPTLHSYEQPKRLKKLDTKPKLEPDSFQLNSITGDILPLEAYTPDYKPKETFQCPKCPKFCTTAKLLQRHLGIHRTIQNYENGRTQAKRTRRANQRRREREVAETPPSSPEKFKDEYICTCGETFTRRSRMESCMRTHDTSNPKARFNCVTCKDEFKNKAALTEHKKRSHAKKKFPCKFCPTDHASRKELFKHLRLHQKSQLVEFKVMSQLVGGGARLKCVVCHTPFGQLDEFKSHVLRDHATFPCAMCDQSYAIIGDLVAHLKTHDKVKGRSLFDVLEAFARLAQSWKCDECGLQFYHTDELALHQRVHLKSTVKEPSFQCTDCRRVFVSAKSLNVHRRIYHNVLDIPEPERGILCVHCRKVCQDEAALTTHMRFHAAERKYVCKFCDFRFATLEKRKSHAEIHTGDMRYVCFICEYRCSSENRLKNHRKSAKHLSMKEFLINGTPIKEDKDTVKEGSRECNDSGVSCDICGDRFSSDSEMQSHKQTHPFIEFPNEDRPTRIFFK